MYVIANPSGKYIATCERSSTTASRDSTTIETTSGVHDKSLGTQRKSALQIHEIELGPVINLTFDASIEEHRQVMKLPSFLDFQT